MKGRKAREDGAASLGLRLLTRSLQEPVRLRSRFSCRSRSNGYEASLGLRLLTRSLQEPVRLRSCVDAVRRSERHGIFRLRGFHGHAGHIGKTALFVGEQRHDRQTRLLFFIYREYDEVRSPRFNIETSHREGSSCLEADRADLTKYVKQTASCRHRRSSTPGGSERGEDPALPTAEGRAEPVPSGKRVSADTGRCNVIHLT